NPNYYLIGYALEQEGNQLRCVSFQDGEFISIPLEEFLRDRVQLQVEERCFTINHGLVSRVDFTNDTPEGFRGQSMNLPSGFYPYRFDHKNRLILVGTSSIAFVDNSLRIISKINFKGQITSIQDHYVITTTFGSFFYYGYEAGARIRIYRLIEIESNDK
ncbi:MAG: hypothetical protein U1C51_07220, partial [Candidatus Izemoplasmatales bacterium]|nr:hypothetical protein [Candidatus Izemoplasmatales bacterium]